MFIVSIAYNYLIESEIDWKYFTVSVVVVGADTFAKSARSLSIWLWSGTDELCRY